MAFKMLQMWITYVKNTFYRKTFLKFGSFKNTPICDLSSSYINWIIEKEIVMHDNDLNAQLSELAAMQPWALEDAFKYSQIFNHAVIQGIFCSCSAMRS